MFCNNHKVFKYCVVPQCENTTTETPNKMFISLPTKEHTRRKWLKIARRDPNSLRLDSRLYFCEDHFDLPLDMTNYKQYCMGYASQIQLRKNCLPSKFECQLDSREKDQKIMKSYSARKKNSSIISTTDTSTTNTKSYLSAKIAAAPCSFNYGTMCLITCGNKKSVNYCFCCLSKMTALIPIANCSHYDNYKKLIDIKNSDIEEYICIVCHSMLKKIDDFNNMVIESNKIIASKAIFPNNFRKKFVDLQTSKLPNIDETEYQLNVNVSPLINEDSDENSVPVIKQEKEDDDIDYEKVTVKIEPLSETPMLTEIEILPDVLISDSLPQASIKQENESNEMDVGLMFADTIRVVYITKDEYDEEMKALEKTNEYYANSMFKCKNCFIGFANNSLLQDHLNAEHDYDKEVFNKMQCCICDLFVDELSDHVEAHLRRFECSVCNWKCKDRDTILKHVESHETTNKSRESGSSPIRKKVSKTQLKLGRVNINPSSTHVKRYKEMNRMYVRRYREVNREKIIQQREAEKNRKNLAKSLELDKLHRKFTCPVCQNVYSSKGALTRHTKKAHGKQRECSVHIPQTKDKKKATNKKKTYVCLVCQRICETRQYLKRHLDSHGFRLECDYCKKLFKCRKTIQEHIITKHLNSSEFTCQLCSEAFSSKKCLDEHIQSTHEEPAQEQN